MSKRALRLKAHTQAIQGTVRSIFVFTPVFSFAISNKNKDYVILDFVSLFVPFSVVLVSWQSLEKTCRSWIL